MQNVIQSQKNSVGNTKISLKLSVSKGIENIGPLLIKSNQNDHYAIEEISFYLNRRKLHLLDYSQKIEQETMGLLRYSLQFEKNIQLLLNIPEKSPYIYFSDPEVPSHDLTKLKLTLKIRINFQQQNKLDYLNLSGNLYRRVDGPIRLRRSTPVDGCFSQVWMVHHEDKFAGIIGHKSANTTKFGIKVGKKKVEMSQTLAWKKGDPQFNLYIAAGNGGYDLPIQLKEEEICPTEPLDLTYPESLQQEAEWAFNTLSQSFVLDSKSGKIPSNFIFPFRDKEGKLKLLLPPYGSFGNCFHLGYITGASALYLWTKKSEISAVLRDEFLPPVLNDAQIQEGKLQGAFFDSYNNQIDKWTTGRVQFPSKGFSNFFPYPEDYKSKVRVFPLEPLKSMLRNGLLDFLTQNWAQLMQVFRDWPENLWSIKQKIIYPPYSGQFAYNLLQIYHESKENSSYLGITSEEKLNHALNSAAKFLLDFQRSDFLWDHELNLDGTIFWDKRSLACIYPAAFLYLWGKELGDAEMIARGTAALNACRVFVDRGQYFGVYFETDLAHDQSDLVSAVAAIKCFSRIYTVSKDPKWLDTAKKATWHLITYMWGTGAVDKKGKPITGGVPVTTYKAMGFPVIGGSELCQAAEALLEISQIDQKFLVYAEAVLGYHAKYLNVVEGEFRATHEIMWGTLGNWSNTASFDYASYGTGPLVRSLYLYSELNKTSD